jgi:hypothetical protein
MMDQPSDSDFELNTKQFLQLAIGTLAGIVCVAGCVATFWCFFGEELKLLFGLRAMIVAAGSGYGAYYCFSNVSSQ